MVKIKSTKFKNILVKVTNNNPSDELALPHTRTFSVYFSNLSRLDPYLQEMESKSVIAMLSNLMPDVDSVNVVCEYFVWCSKCNRTCITAFDKKQCEMCEILLCGSCQTVCKSCDTEFYCDDCCTQCCDCGHLTCPECIVDCNDCYAKLCDKCCQACSCDDTSLCRQHAIRCDNCDGPTCRECRFACDKCGLQVCESCSHVMFEPPPHQQPQHRICQSCRYKRPRH